MIRRADRGFVDAARDTLPFMAAHAGGPLQRHDRHPEQHFAAADLSVGVDRCVVDDLIRLIEHKPQAQQDAGSDLPAMS